MQTVTTLRHTWSNTVSIQFQIIDDKIKTAKKKETGCVRYLVSDDLRFTVLLTLDAKQDAVYI